MRELMLSALCTLALTTTTFASTTDLASTFSTEIKEIPLSPEENELLDQNVDPGEIIATAERIRGPWRINLYSRPKRKAHFSNNFCQNQCCSYRYGNQTTHSPF